MRKKILAFVFAGALLAATAIPALANHDRADNNPSISAPVPAEGVASDDGLDTAATPPTDAADGHP